MKLDSVHDLQTVYRKLVDSTSRPGFISDLVPEADKLDDTVDFSESILLLALTLLDPEVSFKVYSKESHMVSEKISTLTYAKKKDADEADYIFVLKDAEEGSLVEAIQQGKPGTLKDPHVSATIITEVDRLSDDGELLLTGPGIQKSNTVAVGESDSWVEARQFKNTEYPMGIDLLFVDKQHQLLALPRTTRIIKNRVMN
ncbi:phosphonate C-P lyase system protein PhnH [Bacillus dakarensis]|uniref:phosphonate C-P lyase system protein PhnH n=1 Tax=Robertmurraya dakarensis TaxID=1926278 RepID=UPI00098163B3|nr:phosphonate C-P lyase system protein PhnH [Bacillus dakarensis]